MASKLDCFLLAAKYNLYNERQWLLSAFSVVEDSPQMEVDVQIAPLSEDTVSTDKEHRAIGRIFRKDAIPYVVLENGESDVIDGVKAGDPVFRMKEEVSLSPNEAIPNLKGKVTSTYGRLLVNLMILCFPFGERYPYRNEEFKGGELSDFFAQELTDDRVTVPEIRTFFNQLFFLSSLTTLCVPSASEKATGTDPNIAKRKKELLEQYKDSLDDPATIAKIEGELVQMDRDYLKGDVSEGFYTSSKSFNIHRKKMHIMQGGEARIDGSGKMDLVTDALAEKWSHEDMPAKLNASRLGSYSRGAETALGGEAVKAISRTYQNSSIAMEDCNTKIGIPVDINEMNYSSYLGRYILGKTTPLTLEALKGLIGKTIIIRSPMTCKAPQTDYCAVCMGDAVSKSPQALSMLAVQLGSAFMGTAMSMMHSRELLTKVYDFKNRIS